jgi:phage shock protein PspC (stress-responsive transcriptional regulator)
MPKKAKDLSLKNLRCIPDKGWFGGVCAGLAYWLGLPLWLVRLAWGAAGFFYGLGITLYLLLWIFVPNAEEVPADYGRRTGDG